MRYKIKLYFVAHKSLNTQGSSVIRCQLAKKYLRLPTTCIGVEFFRKRFSDIPAVIGCLGSGSRKRGTSFPLVDKAGFWPTNVLEGLPVEDCSMTLQVPGGGDHVEN